MKSKKTIITILLSNLIILSVFGCNTTKSTIKSNKTNEELNKIKMEQIVQKVEEEESENNPIQTTGNDTIKKYGVDSIKTIMNYSLYIEYFKQDNYKDAYKYWGYLYSNAPKFNKGVYINGVKMIKDFIKKSKDDDALKNKWIDSLFMIYNQRITYFNEKGFVIGKKGKDLFILDPSRYEEAYKLLEKSIILEKDNSSTVIPYYFMYTTTIMLKQKKIDESILVQNFVTATTIINNNIAKGNKVSKWEKINNNVVQLTSPYLKFEVLEPIFTEKFNNNKDNLSDITNMISLLDNKRYTGNNLYMMLSERAYELEPSFKAAYSLGNAHYGKGNYSKAIFYYEKAVNAMDDSNVDKAKYYMSLAEAQRKAGSLMAARSNARKSASLNHDDGTPYIFIGDLYASSYSNCGNSTFEKKAVYWIAVDQYYIARSKGDKNASSRISKYSQHFPTKEESFYQEPPVKDGANYSIGCWINATTKARFNE